MKRLLIALCLVLGLSIVGATDYIYGEGKGASYDEAFAEAQVQISQQISVRVESVSEITNLDIEEDGKHYYRDEIEKNTKLTVDRVLTNLEVISKKEKKGKHKVKLGLDKAKFVNSLRGELDTIRNSATTLVDEADMMVASGKPLFAVNNYREAQELLPELFAKKAFYDNFAREPYFIPPDLSISAIDSALRDMFTKIRFSIVSGTDQSAINGETLPELIVFRAEYAVPRREPVPIASFPVRLNYGDGKLITRGVTDNEGYFKAEVKAIPLSGANKVQIFFNPQGIPGYLAKLTGNIMSEVYYEIEAAEKIGIALDIYDENGHRDESLSAKVAKALSGSNFVVQPFADLSLYGNLEIKDVLSLDSLSGQKHIATLELDLFLKRASTQSTLGTFPISQKSSSSKSEKDAIATAKKQLKVDARKLPTKLMEFLKSE